MSKNKHGFTIVELLIVIVVIGILAAIVIVAYTGVTNKANDAALRSDMRNNAAKLMRFEVENDKLPTASETSSGVTSLSFTKQSYNYVLLCVNGNPPGYITLRATSKSGLTLMYDTFTKAFQEVALPSDFNDCASTCKPEGPSTPNRCLGGVTDHIRIYNGNSWRPYW